MAINNIAPDLAIELQRIYDSEINVRIGWLWDGGIEVRLGDDMNGYLAEETVNGWRDLFPGCSGGIYFVYGVRFSDLSFGVILHAVTPIYNSQNWCTGPPTVHDTILVSFTGTPPTSEMRSRSSATSFRLACRTSPWPSIQRQS